MSRLALSIFFFNFFYALLRDALFFFECHFRPSESLDVLMVQDVQTARRIHCPHSSSLYCISALSLIFAASCTKFCVNSPFLSILYANTGTCTCIKFEI